MIRSLLALLALALAAAPAAAADDLAATLALPVASGLTGARGVARFAWVVNAAGVRNVWVADKGGPARRVTAFAQDDGVEIYDLALADDGAALAYVRGGDGEFPEGRLPNAGQAASVPEQEVWVASLDAAVAARSIGLGHAPVFAPDGSAVAFTRRGEIWLWRRGEAKAERIAAVTGEVQRLQWSPDGARLLFVDDRNDHSFAALLDVAERTLSYVASGLGFAAEPVFAPDGKRVAFVFYVDPPAGAVPGSAATTAAYWSVRVADLASGAVTTAWSAPAGLGGRYAGTRSYNLFWGAGDRLVFPWEGSGWLHPYAVDVAGGPARDLTPGAFEVDSFWLAPDRKSIVYAANAGDLERRHVWRVATGGGAPVRLSNGAGSESFPFYAGDALAAMATDAVHPAYPALIGSKTTPIGPVAEAKGFVAPEPVTFRAEDGGEVHAQYFRGAGKGPHAALIFVHGGPRRQMLPGFHTSSYYSNAYVLNQHLARQGYDVLSVNYRSGTGYGLGFREAAGIGREGASEYRDVLAGGRWLAAQGRVDAKRIGIWGGSWGGYLAALALARDSGLFAAGVDFHGVHSMLRTVEANLSPEAQAAVRQLQWESSPMGALATWRSPVLLIHGDDDRNVDFAQSLLLARELRARGVGYEELVFPNERHGFLRYADWLAAYRATVDFFGRTLAVR